MIIEQLVNSICNLTCTHPNTRLLFDLSSAFNTSSHCYWGSCKLWTKTYPPLLDYWLSDRQTAVCPTRKCLEIVVSSRSSTVSLLVHLLHHRVNTTGSFLMTLQWLGVKGGRRSTDHWLTILWSGLQKNHLLLNVAKTREMVIDFTIAVYFGRECKGGGVPERSHWHQNELEACYWESRAFSH